MADRPWEAGTPDERWDGYFVPGHPGVLRNRLGITDAAELAQAEADITGARAHLLHRDPTLIPQTFDADHVKAIHAYLFQDVYEWAGEPRTVGMAKPFGANFAPPQQIPEFLDTAVGYLRDHQLSELPLRGDDGPTAPRVLAAAYITLNYSHPFREGNGRTQRMFMDHAAAEHGLTLDWSRATWREPSTGLTWNDVASHQGVAEGDPSLTLEMFEHITSPALSADALKAAELLRISTPSPIQMQTYTAAAEQQRYQPAVDAEQQRSGLER